MLQGKVVTNTAPMVAFPERLLLFDGFTMKSSFPTTVNSGVPAGTHAEYVAVMSLDMLCLREHFFHLNRHHEESCLSESNPWKQSNVQC